ncbi:hypothetical protein GQ43DRAFT_415660 [Delitschia confertaspora ATCC 74209]|uniref:Autophagy-related protein 6 n=1 Tax=Delitschia confertaspora ATCC 74209 TaxID=1513339 RepID=A0A9P4MSY4_9PLEO|nr:hypothetical protein GQ43DRAFT_415660 [Delitschia confertaspora ATCC 74209]
MGWLWNSGGQSSAKNNLDSGLQDFLENSAHAPPEPTTTQSPTTSVQQTTSSEFTDESRAPPPTQFKDGRYAHLWKTYQPLEELENRGKTDQEKLQDVVDTYNARKARIGEIAQENCSLEYMEQYECFRHPSWTQMATVCRAEQKKFNRCYTMQSKFLMALGYLTMDERPQDEYDRIQLHADKLYRQMIEQEEAINKAKAAGQPIPEFEPVMSKTNVARVMGIQASNITDDDVWKDIKPSAREQYEKKFAKLSKEEQEIERRAVEGELRVNNSMTKTLEAAFIEERIARMKRRETGQATVGDMIKTWWGWG